MGLYRERTMFFRAFSYVTIPRTIPTSTLRSRWTSQGTNAGRIISPMVPRSDPSAKIGSSVQSYKRTSKNRKNRKSIKCKVQKSKKSRGRDTYSQLAAACGRRSLLIGRDGPAAFARGGVRRRPSPAAASGVEANRRPPIAAL